MPFVRLADRTSSDPHQVELTVSQWPYEFVISCRCMPATSNGLGREELGRMPMGVYEGVEASNEIMRLWRIGKHNPLAPALSLEPPGYRWVWVS